MLPGQKENGLYSFPCDQILQFEFNCLWVKLSVEVSHFHVEEDLMEISIESYEIFVREEDTLRDELTEGVIIVDGGRISVC